MSPAALIDANIPMYVAGDAHPLKEPCTEILRLAAAYPQSMITDAEVLQEMLHRYLAVRRWRQGRVVLMGFAELMGGRTEPVYDRDVTRAAELADTYPELGSRDLLHAAVMQRLGITRIISADRGFDRIAGIERLDPANLAAWRVSLDY